MAKEPVVFVVDDEPRMRGSLALLLKSAGLQAQTYGSAEEFLDDYEPSTPSCLVLDLCMEDMSGLELQQELARRRIDIPHVVISGYAEVPSVVSAVKAGAIDVLEKPFRDEILLRRVREALEQDRKKRRETSRRQEIGARFALLSERERQVMRELVSGKHTKRIARELSISPKTVHAHRTHILEKMEVDSVVELAQSMRELEP